MRQPNETRGRKEGFRPATPYNLRRKPDILSRDIVAETYKACGGEIKRKDIAKALKQYNDIQQRLVLMERKSVQIPGLGIIAPTPSGTTYVPTLKAENP